MRRRTGPSTKTVHLVRARDLWACVRCGGIHCLQTHHRKPRGMGGTKDPAINSPANLITLCAGCHTWVETHRRDAGYLGLIVPQGHNPAEVQLYLYRQGFALLADDGTVELIDWKEPA